MKKIKKISKRKILKNKISKQKISKRKILKKVIRLSRNPWEEDNEIEKSLDKLVGEDVILQIANWVNIISPQNGPSITNKGSYKLVPRNFYGILKNSKYEDRYNNPYIFQFNPLNQWKFGGIDPNLETSSTFGFIQDEESGIMMQEEGFRNNNPTYEWEFNVKQIFGIDGIKIKLYDDSLGLPPIFQPKPIPDFGVWGL